MSNPRPANPQPTSGTNGARYDSFLWPRSKTPEKQAIYDILLWMKWRYDATTHLWYTPEDQPLEGRGVLEYDGANWAWFRIQPASYLEDGAPLRSEPLLYVALTPEGELQENDDHFNAQA